MGHLIISNDVTDAMKAELIIAEMLGLTRPQYTLRQLCRVVDFGKSLSGKVPVGTSLVGKEKVPQLVAADLASQAYVDISFDLWKNVVHIALSAESEFTSTFNLMQMNTQDAAKELARMENSQINEILDTLTGNAGSNWDDVTKNPMKDIMNNLTDIQSLGFTPDFMTLSPDVYAALVFNDYTVEAFARGALVNGNIPSIAGLKVLVDANLTAKQAIIMDTKAPTVILADGPAIVVEYEGGASFFKGYATAKFLQPKKAMSTAAVRITGVHS